MPAKDIKTSPPIKIAIPPMIVSMAITATPIGLYVFEFKLISKNLLILQYKQTVSYTYRELKKLNIGFYISPNYEKNNLWEMPKL